MDLDHCVKLLKNAKTDNEMMAALMLVRPTNYLYSISKCMMVSFKAWLHQ